MIETFPWWNERQKELAEEVKQFADENIPRGEEVNWAREFPTDLVTKVAKRGWFGAIIPKEYRGLGLGVTGTCIISEHLGRICDALGHSFTVTMFGGVEQLAKFGNEDQKRRWLPKVAKGDLLGAICITEPFVGSDVAATQTTAERDGDEYVINGKKRFITNAGAAGIYLVYAKTSERPEDQAKYRHLSAFIVEKGTSGFSVERINELGGWIGVLNGYLDFNDCRVPAENMLGIEGDGWKVCMDGLNFERNLFSAAMLGGMREAIRYAVAHSQRRIQFGKPSIEFEVNQFKIANMISRLLTARLLVYHSAHLMDANAEAVLEATNAKLFTSEAYREIMNDAVQVMGGDGWTRFYPLDAFNRDSKVNEMGAGTSEVMRIVLYRQGVRSMGEALRMPSRVMHRKLEVPVSTLKPPTTTEINEKSVLDTLAEDYRVNPGLYMSREDMKMRLLGVDDEQLDKLLMGLKSKALVSLYRDKRGMIKLAKATYKGLREAKPLERYKWFPEWVRKDMLF